MFFSLVSVAYTEADMIRIKMVNLLYIRFERVLFNPSLIRCQVSWKAIKSIKSKNPDVLQDAILFNIETVFQIPQSFFPSRTKYSCTDLLPVQFFLFHLNSYRSNAVELLM